MPITLSPDLEALLRDRADAAGIGVEAYLERIAREEQEAEEEIEALALEAVRSGEPLEAGPAFWRERHSKLEQRLKSV